jgi:hypothetical protein
VTKKLRDEPFEKVNVTNYGCEDEKVGELGGDIGAIR